METTKSNKKTLLGLGILVIILALLAGAYLLFSPKPTIGAKSITIEVIDNQSNSNIYTINTDAQYLSEVMDEATSEGFSYDGEVGDYGLTIYSINNIVADFNVDSAYWSIMVNGEYGQYGADSQIVTDGDAFQFIYTVFTQ